MTEYRDYSLLKHNTFGIDVICKRFLAFEDVSELPQLLKGVANDDQPLWVLGAGSNVLFTKNYPGTILYPINKGVTVESCGNEVLVTCAAGENWDAFVGYCVKQGWYGLENLSYIPGHVGASAVQNIGAYGVEVKDYIHAVEAYDRVDEKWTTIAVEDCAYSYRHSRFKTEWKQRYIITRVVFRLSTIFTPITSYGNVSQKLEEKGVLQPTAQCMRDIIIEIRKEKLPEPEVEGNAGSFFMNPVVENTVYQKLVQQYPDIPYYVVDAEKIKIPAGWLIERAGWKGKVQGRVGVHPKQALVLVNKGGAKGEEVVALCNAIVEDIASKFDIRLKPEVNIL